MPAVPRTSVHIKFAEAYTVKSPKSERNPRPPKVSGRKRPISSRTVQKIVPRGRMPLGTHGLQQSTQTTRSNQQHDRDQEEERHQDILAAEVGGCQGLGRGNKKGRENRSGDTSQAAEQ